MIRTTQGRALEAARRTEASLRRELEVAAVQAGQASCCVSFEGHRVKDV